MYMFRVLTGLFLVCFILESCIAIGVEDVVKKVVDKVNINKPDYELALTAKPILIDNGGLIPPDNENTIKLPVPSDTSVDAATNFGSFLQPGPQIVEDKDLNEDANGSPKEEALDASKTGNGGDLVHAKLELTELNLNENIDVVNSSITTSTTSWLDSSTTTPDYEDDVDDDENNDDDDFGEDNDDDEEEDFDDEIVDDDDDYGEDYDEDDDGFDDGDDFEDDYDSSEVPDDYMDLINGYFEKTNVEADQNIKVNENGGKVDVEYPTTTPNWWDDTSSSTQWWVDSDSDDDDDDNGYEEDFDGNDKEDNDDEVDDEEIGDADGFDDNGNDGKSGELDADDDESDEYGDYYDSKEGWNEDSNSDEEIDSEEWKKIWDASSDESIEATTTDWEATTINWDSWTSTTWWTTTASESDYLVDDSSEWDEEWDDDVDTEIGDKSYSAADIDNDTSHSLIFGSLALITVGALVILFYWNKTAVTKYFVYLRKPAPLSGKQRVFDEERNLLDNEYA